MTHAIDCRWNEVDSALLNLPTGVEHELRVQREAIPIIFVPGVMGSRLRRAGTDGTGTGAAGSSDAGLPNLRWDPAAGFLWKHFSGKTPAHRKSMLIGEDFLPGYLEVDNDSPVGNGERGLMKEYRDFLRNLRTRDWGALGKLFVFPVYGFGYNWLDTNRAAGMKLAARISEVIAESARQTGACNKVILVTHSMGGLVARSACRISGAEANVLGIVHGVQPAYGSGAAYWRIKAGFEGGGFVNWLVSRFLGPSGRDTTALLGNSPGGLQLLPTKRYRTNNGDRAWLQVRGLPEAELNLPIGDPYEEIYRRKAVVRPPAGSGQSSNAWWGLVDPDLLEPALPVRSGGNGGVLDQAMDLSGLDDYAWDRYLGYLGEAENFHDEVGAYLHPRTFRFHGYGLKTAEFVRFDVESNWVRSENYPARCFRGFFRSAKGKDMQAVIADPGGDGDGTVPVSSAIFLGSGHHGPGSPGDGAFKKLEHQPAYEDSKAERWVVCAITALCKAYFTEKHG